MSTTLTEMIDNLVLEKTMSLDALNAINALKSQATMLNNHLREADKREEISHKRIESLYASLNEKNEEIHRLNNRIGVFEKGMEKAQKVEIEGIEAKAELKGFTDAMQMVFKPSVVRESFQKVVPVPVQGCPAGPNGSYPSPGFVLQSEETGIIERSAE